MASSLPSLPVVPGTDPERSVFDSFRTSIAKKLSDALPLTLEQAYSGVDFGKKGVDFTVALPRFRLPGKTDELAAKIISKFEADGWIESVTHDKQFLHFQLNSNTLVREVLTQVHKLQNLKPFKKWTKEDTSEQPKLLEYGMDTSGENKTVIMEYSSPNIAKEFHLGHLRSTIIGAFLANLYYSCGWNVIRMNYLGDWGTQFGMIATGYAKYGSEEELEKDPIGHLRKVYIAMSKEAEHDPKVKANAAEWFNQLEGDRDAGIQSKMLKDWEDWRARSIKKYEQSYNMLNVKFDIYNGESVVGKQSMDQALEQLEAIPDLVLDVDGAKILDLEKFNLGKTVLRNKDGSSIYLTRDIAGGIERFEKYKFDKMIYVVASQQNHHFLQYFKILELMGLPWANKLEHVNFGMVKGMSTRTGTGVSLNGLIDDAARVMKVQMGSNPEKFSAVEDVDMTSREIGITGIKIQDMAAKRINDYTYNEERMLSIEGDTGPYLQYAHARLTSLKAKNIDLHRSKPEDVTLDSLAPMPHAREIAFLLGKYPDVVRTAMKTHEPSGVVTYAFQLSHAISSAWETVIVKGEEDEEKAGARLFLYERARDVLGGAMRLLSIRPLERM